MVESLSHRKLKEQAKQMLIEEGYNPSNIKLDTFWFEQELNGIKLSFRVDVYASNGSKKVVECGNFPLWKHPYYYAYFGEENVKHLPYPLYFSRYNLQDSLNELDKKQAKQFLMDSYNRYIYSEFKDDGLYEFIEFNQANRDKFDIDHHKKIKEINPDNSYEQEISGRDIWMNFPTARVNTKKEYMAEIHWGMIYYNKSNIKIVILMSGKEATRKFLELSQHHHQKVFEELKNLPTCLNFRIRQGNSFWLNSHRPPLDKNWCYPIPCSDLTFEDYEGIIKDQENLCKLTGQNVGPVMELVGVYTRSENIPEVIEKLKPLYKLLLKPDTIIDEIIRNIKAIKVSNPNSNWRYHVYNRDKTFLHKLYEKDFGPIEISQFSKAWNRLKTDPEYLEYSKK